MLRGLATFTIMSNDFHIFLNNNNSLKKYNTNNVSHFTNDIIPPIVFEDSNSWEVAILSCILPFESYSASKFTDKDTIDLLWVISEVEQPDTVRLHRHLVKLPLHMLLGLKPEKIVKKIINASETVSGKISSFFNQFLNIYGDKIAITQYFLKKPFDASSPHPFENVVNIDMIINENTQRLFGLDNQKYNIFNIDSERSISEVGTIIGDREIGFNLISTEYIIIYTDIIKHNTFGPHNLSILDILPFGENRMCERKMNEPIYSI